MQGHMVFPSMAQQQQQQQLCGMNHVAAGTKAASGAAASRTSFDSSGAVAGDVVSFMHGLKHAACVVSFMHGMKHAACVARTPRFNT